MAEINTTSINDLPTDPTGGGSVGGNVHLNISETPPPVNNSVGIPQSNSLTLDQNTISQIVNGLQQASLAGATQLPSRDIPMSTNQLTQDMTVQPNFVPPPQRRDYIYENNDDMEYNYYRKENVNNTLDSFYDEFQIPLLLIVLYFIFQLPIFKRTIFKYAPFMCHNDGNYNITGLIFTCGLFGLFYYIIFKTMKSFNKF